MSKRAAATDNDSDGAGCLFFIGAIILACCIGHLNGEVYGWATFGMLLVILGVMSR